jgi:hypothetical protein
MGSDKPLANLRSVIPWFRQYTILLKRSLQEIRRSWELIVIQLVNAVVMAVLVGFVFFRIGTYQVSTKSPCGINMLGFCYECVTSLYRHNSLSS